MFDVIDASTGEVFAHCPEASAEDLNTALVAAGSTFAEWSRRSWDGGGASLAQLARLVRQRSAELAELLMREQGKRLHEANIVATSAANLERFAGVSP